MNRPHLCSSHHRRFWWVAVVFSPLGYVFRLLPLLGRVAKAAVPLASALWYYYAPARFLHAIALWRTPRDPYFSFWKRLLRP
jgi:hypothetical protein